MLRRPVVTILVICLLTLYFGCTVAPHPGQKGAEVGEEPEQIEDFDPVSLDDDGILILEELEGLDIEGEGEETGREQVVRPKAEEGEYVSGYRVQIYLSADLESARNVLVVAKREFSEEAYLKYDVPYYKVRVGDCLSRADADELLKEAVSKGFIDAWVVRTLVKKRVEKD